jgi:hypothetical protein
MGGSEVSGLLMSWPWVWTVLSVITAGYAAFWWLTFWHGRRARAIGWEDGYDAAIAAAGVGELAGPEFAGTITMLGHPDDTFPGYLPTGRHAAVQMEAAERMTTTGDLAMTTARLNAALFLAELEDWDVRTMAKLEGMLT